MLRFIVIVLALVISDPSVALTRSELEEEIADQRQRWFMDIYRSINGIDLPRGTDFLEVQLKRGEIRDFVLDAELLNRAVELRIADVMCGALVGEARVACSSDPSDYFRGQEGALSALSYQRRILNEIIFDPSGTVTDRYALQVDNSLSQIQTLGGFRFDELDSLTSWLIPAVRVSFGNFIAEKPDTLKQLEEAEPDSTIFEQIAPQLSVRRSYLNSADMAKSAAVGFSNFGSNDETREDGADETVANINASIIWRPLVTFGLVEQNREYLLGDQIDFRPELITGIESQVVTDQDTSLITHFVGGEFVFSRREGDGKGFLANNRFTITFNYKTDRHYDAEIYGGTLQWTPDWHNIGWGRDIFPDDDQIDIRWRPFIDLTVDEIDDVGILPNISEGSQVNLGIRAVGLFKFWNSFSIIPEVKFTQEFEGAEDDHLLYGVTGEYALNEDGNFTLTATYQRGEEGPTFVEQEKVTFGIGLKF